MFCRVKANGADNVTLGGFRLDGIPGAAKVPPNEGGALILTPNRIVHVSAKDLGTGKEQEE